MRYKKADMTESDMKFATEMARRQVDDLIQLGHAMEHDTQSNERRNQQLCKACYYPHRVAGQAITTRACMCCGEEQTYGNTSADKLCHSCARVNALCKKCGGDIEMRVRRQNWPKPSAE